MAAEVSSLMRLLTRRDKDDGGGEGNHGGDLVTRDLLGGCCGGDSKEVDLGLGSSSASENHIGITDLNMPPIYSSGFLLPPRPAAHGPLQGRPTGATALDLGLRPSVPPPQAEYQSVCTLEKVRCALERVQRESPSLRKPPPLPGPSSPATSSTTTSSAKRLRGEEEGEREAKSPSSSSSSSSVVVQGGGDERGAGAARMAAAACPSCLLYVLIARSDPRCPRCNAAVPLPLPPPPPPPRKSPRIDLNAVVAGAEAAAPNPLRTVNFF